MNWSGHGNYSENSDLGDARRSARLVNVASRMAKQMGSPLAKSCGSDQAALLGSYRLMRNGAVKPESIRASGFAGTAKSAQEAKRLLAIEDTTCVNYGHAVAARLGLTGGKQTAKWNGFMVHSVLLLNAESGYTLCRLMVCVVLVVPCSICSTVLPLSVGNGLNYLSERINADLSKSYIINRGLSRFESLPVKW